jgi:hypothetical protein
MLFGHIIGHKQPRRRLAGSLSDGINIGRLFTVDPNENRFGLINPSLIPF